MQQYLRVFLEPQDVSEPRGTVKCFNGRLTFPVFMKLATGSYSEVQRRHFEHLMKQVGLKTRDYNYFMEHGAPPGAYAGGFWAYWSAPDVRYLIFHAHVPQEELVRRLSDNSAGSRTSSRSPSVASQQSGRQNNVTSNATQNPRDERPLQPAGGPKMPPDVQPSNSVSTAKLPSKNGTVTFEQNNNGPTMEDALMWQFDGQGSKYKVIYIDDTIKGARNSMVAVRRKHIKYLKQQHSKQALTDLNYLRNGRCVKFAHYKQSYVLVLQDAETPLEPVHCLRASGRKIGGLNRSYLCALSELTKQNQNLPDLAGSDDWLAQVTRRKPVNDSRTTRNRRKRIPRASTSVALQPPLPQQSSAVHGSTGDPLNAHFHGQMPVGATVVNPSIHDPTGHIPANSSVVIPSTHYYTGNISANSLPPTFPYPQQLQPAHQQFPDWPSYVQNNNPGSWF